MMKARDPEEGNGPVEAFRSRRGFFSRVGDGICGAALAYLLGDDLCVANPFLAQAPGRTT